VARIKTIPLTASLLVLDGRGQMAEITSAPATVTVQAPITRNFQGVKSDSLWSSTPREVKQSTHLLRWTCRFSERDGATFCLNIYGTTADTSSDDGPDDDVAVTSGDASASESLSGPTPGKYDQSAVIKTAKERQLERLSDTISRREAELRELRHQLSAAEAGDDSTADGVDESASLAAVLAASDPTAPGDSESDRSAGCDSDELEVQLEAGETLKLRLQFASVALGWVPVGEVATESMYRDRREAALCSERTDIDWDELLEEAYCEDAEPTESQQERMYEAQQQHFWSELEYALKLH
jgi:hypothetical protein